MALYRHVSVLTGSTQSTWPLRPTGSEPGVGPAQPRRRRAPEWLRRAETTAERPGERRDSPTGVRFSRDLARSNGKMTPRPTGVVTRPGVDGGDGGELGNLAGVRPRSGTALQGSAERGDGCFGLARAC